jgi:hypothetical protein
MLSSSEEMRQISISAITAHSSYGIELDATLVCGRVTLISGPRGDSYVSMLIQDFEVIWPGAG